MLKRILAIALLLCVVSVYALADGAVQTAPPESTPAPEEENAAGSEAEPEATPVPAPGYILVRWSTGVGWLPLPREGEYSYPLTQLMPDGSEAVNVIHVTSEGFYMESSTCDNQDCVHQGIVTLHNKKDRILLNMVICLPNQVTLELYTPEEILASLQED